MGPNYKNTTLPRNCSNTNFISLTQNLLARNSLRGGNYVVSAFASYHATTKYNNFFGEILLRGPVASVVTGSYRSFKKIEWRKMFRTLQLGGFKRPLCQLSLLRRDQHWMDSCQDSNPDGRIGSAESSFQ